MAITLGVKTYNQDASLNDGSTVQYTGPINTYQFKELLVLKRTAPKPTSTFAGVARSEEKFVDTQTIGTDKVADSIIAISTSFPVGMTEAAFDALQARLVLYVTSSAFKSTAWHHDLTL